MKNKIIILGILCLVLLSACETYTYEEDTSERVEGTWNEELVVYTKCSDHVVCYYHDGGNDGGMDCFYNEMLLLDKYCG